MHIEIIKRVHQLDFLSIGVHQLLIYGAVFWILIDRPLLIRDRELTSSDIFLDRVGVFSGGMEVVECLFKNGIRFRPLLGSVSFGFVHRCSAYIPASFVM
jgi:hypothetical protein